MTATSRPDFLRRLALAGLCLLGLSTFAHTQARDSAEYTLRVAAKKYHQQLPAQRQSPVYFDTRQPQ